ncbi:MAG: glycoside hydrolase [Acidobacteria bacterium]|nr:glycoside hydrolase [Acidobacteriota bacterium]
MPRIYLTFVWHMHQPFYKDLVTGEYHLPWTRLHALKDYYGMVKILEDFPQVRQTFNLVPSMMVQIQEYAEGKAADPFLRTALAPAEVLSLEQQAFLLRYFFQAHPGHMIYRFPRYGELYDAWCGVNKNPRKARPFFPPEALRDVQVLSQLAWFDEEFLEGDPEVAELVAKERDYTLEDQEWMGRKQLEIINRVMPAYRDFAASGQVEISTTPYYHPILPLLCDSNIAAVSHPYVALPPQFSYPEDARHQLRTAREYTAREFGAAPAGLWPSEGSVSDAAFRIAAEEGFRWAATDNGVLARTLHREAGCVETYRPYWWEQQGQSMHVLFRDHHLSDLVGFVYSKMEAEQAAQHFLDTIYGNCAPILSAGRDALVPVILDGENAWEHYHRNGRPFLRALYKKISEAPGMEAVTVSEALERVPAEPLGHIFPGSWINANFDVWIGASEDNHAWDMVLRARQAYEAAAESDGLTEAQRALAYEELLIAEGSDWCWWYGPEHYSENRAEFDELFRRHVANVYRALNIPPPDDLSRPIIKVHFSGHHQTPSSRLDPVIDGDVTFFEWLGAGKYSIDARSGAMHEQRSLIRELHYGAGRTHLFLRIDFEQDPGEARLCLAFPEIQWNVLLSAAGARIAEDGAPVQAAFRKVLEVAVPFEAIGAAGADLIRVKMSLWQGALPADSLPRDGWLELVVSDPADWGV